MLVNKGISILRLAKFSIVTKGLMGEKFINIISVAIVLRSEIMQSVIEGEEPQGMEKLMASSTPCFN